MAYIGIQKHPLNFNLPKILLVSVAIASFFAMVSIKYDADYKYTCLLPLMYLFSVLFLVNNNVFKYGAGSLSICIFYCFRMCILPVVCAMGNFYLEPYKGDYIDKYNEGILLTSFENCIVFCSLSFYYNLYRLKQHKFPQYSKINSHNIIYYIIIFLTIYIVFVYFIYGIHYFQFITRQIAVQDILMQVGNYESLGAIWYITDMICTLWRPLVSFTLIYILTIKRSKLSLILIFLIAVLNILFLSDRRIYGLLVGGVCFYQLLSLITNRNIKKIILLSVVSGICLTITIGFYGSVEEGWWMIARTFQRYFSGPTLTAMALKVNDIYGNHFFDFFKLLYNDFQLFTGLFGRIDMPDYYYTVFGMSRGLWTPMTAGALRYFGIFFPCVIVLIVRYIVYCDFIATSLKDNLYKMIMSFIAISLACYMVMYSLELIIYFILSYAMILRLIIYVDNIGFIHKSKTCV